MSRIRRLLGLTLTIALCLASRGDEIDDTIAKMSTGQKAGQLFLVGLPGQRLSDEVRQLIEDDAIGGFFVQPLSNFAFPDELAKLTRALQETALSSELGIPLLLAADQEGGVAAAIPAMLGATPTPGNMALGASGRETDTFNAYNAMGNDFRACGLNVNFAPAIDVLTRPENPDYTIRSFSGSLAINTTLARAAVRGLQNAEVIACAKHFPGLAWFPEDTHRAAPRITASREELDMNLSHFREAIDAGTDMIMTAHVYLSAWDRKEIVTLSRPIITGVLREELGYDGLIITDSMGMGAVNEKYGREVATVKAVEAGCDLILQVSRDPGELRARINAVADAIERGRIPEAQIHASLRRILGAKQKYGLYESADEIDPERTYDKLRAGNAVDASRRAALNGVVLVQDRPELLPLAAAGRKIGVVCPASLVTRAGKGDAKIPLGLTLGYHVRQIALEAVEARVDTVPPEHEIRWALEMVEDADVLIVGVLLALQSPEQQSLIEQLLALDKPTILVGLGTPADLADYTEADVLIAANGPADVNLEAVVSVIFGDERAGGKLPLPIGEHYPIGHALNP